jgi:hypothetical protein
MWTFLMLALGAYGIWLVLLGAFALAWGLWALVRMPYDLRQDGRE